MWITIIVIYDQTGFDVRNKNFLNVLKYVVILLRWNWIIAALILVIGSSGPMSTLVSWDWSYFSHFSTMVAIYHHVLTDEISYVFSFTKYETVLSTPLLIATDWFLCRISKHINKMASQPKLDECIYHISSVLTLHYCMKFLEDSSCITHATS